MKRRKIRKYSSFIKFRVMVIGLACFLFASYSISYAIFSQELVERGTIDVALGDAQVVVSDISYEHNHKEASNIETSYSSNIGTFKVHLDQSVGRLHYTVTLTNRGDTNARFVRVDETSSTDSTIGFSLVPSDNIEDNYLLDTSIILAPGESKKFDFVIKFKDDYKYTIPIVKDNTLSYAFIFEPTLRNPLAPITGEIVEDSGDVNANARGAKATVKLNNPNDFDVEVTLSTYRSFTIVDKYGKELGVDRTFHLDANSSDTFTIYIDENDRSIAEGTTTDLVVLAIVEDYGVSISSPIDTIRLTLNQAGKYQVLSSGWETLHVSDDIFGSVATGTGRIYETKGQDDRYTYFYRGAVNNNYFKFGGYTWRILRIDEYGNIRLILNDYIRNNNSVVTQVFKNTSIPNPNTMDRANWLVRLINDKNDASQNSPIYGSIDSDDPTNLRGWYNTYLSQYDKYIVDSNFCLDTENGTAGSSAAGHDVYYYGPYQKTAHDTALYDPVFSCPVKNMVVEKIGLLSIDELVFAGAAHNTANNSFFLNDSSNLSSYWWTLSPSFYDPTLITAGVFYVQPNGIYMDWLNTNILNNPMALRPVITVKGTYVLNGNGTSGNPYEIQELAGN